VTRLAPSRSAPPPIHPCLRPLTPAPPPNRPLTPPPPPQVPTEYFTAVLGPQRKYSCCLYNSPSDSLEKAEANMLGARGAGGAPGAAAGRVGKPGRNGAASGESGRRWACKQAAACSAERAPPALTRQRPLLATPIPPALYCVRAGLRDGQDILELGCGWGSFSLFAARAFPGSRVTAVSNSRTQKEYIMKRAREYGVTNLNVITADMVDFQVWRRGGGEGGLDRGRGEAGWMESWVVGGKAGGIDRGRCPPRPPPPHP
jgi:hypothetical protein